MSSGSGKENTGEHGRGEELRWGEEFLSDGGV